jgi:predicted transcriptional regulator
MFCKLIGVEMKKEDIINHFGGVGKTASALGISRQAVYKWPKELSRCLMFRIADKLKTQLDNERLEVK